MDELNALLQELAANRAMMEINNKCLADLRRQFEESEEYRSFADAQAYYAARVAELEAAVREQALTVYTATGQKSMPGVTVKVFTRLQYDAGQALEWARANLPTALMLDKKRFEAVAKAIDVPCVTLVEEPQAQIAKDLSRFLEDHHD